jgi:hypothetical protein
MGCKRVGVTRMREGRVRMCDVRVREGTIW